MLLIFEASDAVRGEVESEIVWQPRGDVGNRRGLCSIAVRPVPQLWADCMLSLFHTLDTYRSKGTSIHTQASSGSIIYEMTIFDMKGKCLSSSKSNESSRSDQ